MTHLCSYCGAERVLEVLEVWGHDFMLDTCCEFLHEETLQELSADPKYGGELMQQKLQGILPGDPCVRRVSDNGLGGLILDFSLQLVPISFAEMKAFVEKHHRHCQPPKGWLYGAGVFNGSRNRGVGTLVGVVSVGRPVARMLDAHNKQARESGGKCLVVEVNRNCIDPTLPSPLVKNAASKLYGWAARQARSEGAEWIVSYVLDEEEGTTLRAAGWEPDHLTVGRSWSTPGRQRENIGPQGDKVRWRKQLVKTPRIQLAGNGKHGDRVRSRLGECVPQS